MDKSNKFFMSIGVIFTTFFTIAFMLCAYPAIYVISGWLAGHIIELLFGNFVANGLNALFGTTRFSAERLPAICASLGVLGSYFRFNSSSKKKENKSK